MFTQRIPFHFDASHFLPKSEGSNSKLHFHGYSVTIVLQTNELETDGPDAGMASNAGHVTAIIRELKRTYLETKCLNQTLDDLDHPTNEALAQWLFRYIKPRLTDLTAIEIKSTCTPEVIYSDAVLCGPAE